MITVNKIDICCMQEIDVKKDYDCNLLTFAGYKIEIEKNGRPTVAERSRASSFSL